MSEPVAQGKGVGVIAISWDVVAEMLQQALQLPAGYAIQKVEADLSKGLAIARVKSASIPLVKNEPLPTVMPYYRRDDKGNTMLARITVDNKEVYNVDEVGKDDTPHD